MQQTSTAGWVRPTCLVVVAAVLFAWGWVLVLSFNGFGVVLWILAGIAVALAVPGFFWAIAALLACGVCTFAAWATVNGGANNMTALPWIASAAILAILAAVSFRRAMRAGSGYET